MTTANPFDSTPILEGIRRWVEIETPTEAPEQVNQLADLVAEGYRDLPATVERIAGHSGCGDHLVARSSWGQDAPGILVLSHLDTVHPIGFIERLPFRIEGDSAFGPGIYDMKGGAYLAYHAFRQVCADGARPPLGITQLYVSDEEIGSPTSRALIESEGRKAKYVLVTEPARDGGKIVTGRKGVARFEVFIKGVPSHAGTRPEDGRSAIRELGNVIQTLEAMNDLKRGITVNVGVVRGGTKPNVIAEEAYAEVDLRVPTMADADELVAENPQSEIAHRRRQRQGDRRIEPPALRKEQCRRRALRACQDARGGDRLRSGRYVDRRRLRRQFHRAAYRDARRARRRRPGRAYPLRADVHLLDRAEGAAVVPAVPDAAMIISTARYRRPRRAAG